MIGQEIITWKSEQSQTRVISYNKLSMHAISRDLTAFPKSCILCLLNSSEDAGDGELEEDPLLELRFVPEQDSQLHAIYSAIADGQALHPDPDDASSEDMSGDGSLDGTEETALMAGYQAVGNSDMMAGVFTSPEDVANLTPEGMALLHKLDGMLAAPNHVTTEPLSELAPGCVGNSMLLEGRGISEIETEEGQFDDVTLMDDT